MKRYIKKVLKKTVTALRILREEGFVGIHETIERKIIGFIQPFFPAQAKKMEELSWWKKEQKNEKQLLNDWYEKFYTTHFGLNHDFYRNKKILDIGCGPRGSLEWADMASERIGVDPLVKHYRKFGIRHHKMKYVKAKSEKIPFGDNYFDIITSFNSLDHVDSVYDTIFEITRVLKPGGLFLLLTEVGHSPTTSEPHDLPWEIVQEFLPYFEVITEKHYEVGDRNGPYYGIIAGIPYDHSNKTKRPGSLSVKFRKVKH